MYDVSKHESSLYPKDETGIIVFSVFIQVVL